jgi:riboflavin kinase/FMN adenylyltransferase
MQIINSIKKISQPAKPIVLTIGYFDGLHLGHQKILQEMLAISNQKGEQRVVLTFKNHPSEIVRPEIQIKHIYTLPHKIKLFEETGIDVLLILPFTKELSQQSAVDFLRDIYKVIPFSDLILGHDATLGRGREGNRERVEEYVKSLNSNVKYLSPYEYDGDPVSSSRIRLLIQKGNLKEASQLLGRPYSIYAPLSNGSLEVNGLCLPPEGKYPVQVKYQDSLFISTAIISQNNLHLTVHDIEGIVEIIF